MTNAENFTTPEDAQKPELEGVEEFATKILKLHRLMELIIEDETDRLPTEKELQVIEAVLTEIWVEAGLTQETHLIKSAFEPLFKDLNNKERYRDSINQYKDVTNVIPYKIMSGSEFLGIAKNKAELQKFMAADITEHVKYFFLLHFDIKINPPKPSPTRDNRGGERGFSGTSSWEPSEPKYSEKDKEKASEIAQRGEFPINFMEMSHEEFVAYQEQLLSYSIRVIGCDNIRWGMQDGKSFQETLDKLVKEATIYFSAKQDLDKLQLTKNKMEDQVISYQRLIKAAGPHSKLGMFYREQISKINLLLFGEKTVNQRQNDHEKFPPEELSREEKISRARQAGTLRSWAGSMLLVPGDVGYYSGRPV